MKVILAGGTGFIGKGLVRRLLGEGHQVVVLSRRVDAFKDVASPELKVELWDAKNGGPWEAQFSGADAVVNLAGEGIAGKRWTRRQKALLRASRLDATRLLVSALSRAKDRPRALVSASAVGYYGEVPEGDVTEDHPKGKGFLADLCAEWEAEALKARGAGARVAVFRIGVVLDKSGGALSKFLPPFKLYLGGPLGSGRQFFPWVHRADVVGALYYAVRNPSVSGIFNLVSPGVLTMKDFCGALGRALGRPCWAPVPAFVLRVALGEMAGMLVTGQKAVPGRLRDAGYHFRFENAEEALADILSYKI